MLALRQSLLRVLGLSPEVQDKLLLSLLVLLVLWLLRRILLRTVRRRNQDVRIHYQWQKVSGYVTAFVGALLLARIWLHVFGSLTTYFGLLSAGIAIALKDLLVNLAGWIFILWRRPFDVGDRIEIGPHAGDVIDVRIFEFSLLEIGKWVHADQSTGRVLHIPNGWVLTHSLANFTRGFNFIWNEIEVLVTFESNWQQAKDILLDVARRHSEHLSEEAEKQVRRTAQRYLIFYSKLTPIVYTSVENSGVRLTIRYLCEVRKRRGSAQAIWEDILTTFAGHDDIDFAYPTQRFYDNVVEGKPAARAEPLPPMSRD